jgi:pyruvate, water dikinase
MGRIAAAFYPKDVIVRMSDFKTNEYATLVGGKQFEPDEHNPMIGWRGASRYYDPKYEPAFRLECQAFKKLRDEMGFENVKIMVPFCRTVEEGKKVLGIMKEEGLKQGENGLEVYVMVEIPANVILADQFAELFDGFSIGTNDLTQLTLGVDRDSAIVSHVYNEQNEAVKILVKRTIEVAKQHGVKVGICGDAPSTFPEFAQFLVEHGIDSISLTPDAVLPTTLKILEEEKKLGK